MFELLDFFNYPFFNRALIMSVLAGISCGIIGVWILLLNIPFIGVAIAHCAFAGAIIGVFFGINPVFLSFVFCLLFSAVIDPVSKKAEIHNNLSIGLLFSLSIAAAFVFIGLLKEHINEIFGFFWGSLLTTSNADVVFCFIVTVLLLLFIKFFHRGITAIFFSREISKACGIPERLIFFLMLLLVCGTVSLNLHSIGGFLIYSLISLPAVSAYRLTYDIKTMYILSSLFAVLSCICGLFVSTAVSLPAGAVIILAACFIFAVSLIFSKKKSYKN